MTDLPDRPLRRTRMASAELRAAWEEHAAEFIAWARKPGHDSYWRFHRDQFLELLPPPGRRALDLGCGEGRLSRDLKALGHELVAVDVSPTMVAAARKADPDLDALVSDAADLPFEDGSFDLVVAFMSLQDVDDLEGAARRVHRRARRCGLVVERLRETDVPEGAVAKPRDRRWQRLPLFLHIRALKPWPVSTRRRVVRRTERGRSASSVERTREEDGMAGQMVHLEIPAGDTAKAREFWSSLFGWEFQQFPGPTEYHMTRFSESTGGAIYAADGDERGTRVYFDVDDINAGIARVRELGGEAGDAMPVPEQGWFAICKDTEGNAFGLWQTDPSAPAPGA